MGLNQVDSTHMYLVYISDYDHLKLCQDIRSIWLQIKQFLLHFLIGKMGSVFIAPRKVYLKQVHKKTFRKVHNNLFILKYCTLCYVPSDSLCSRNKIIFEINRKILSKIINVMNLYLLLFHFYFSIPILLIYLIYLLFSNSFVLRLFRVSSTTMYSLLPDLPVPLLYIFPNIHKYSQSFSY